MKNRLILIAIIVFILFLSIGYSALNISLTITNRAIVRGEASIYIDSVSNSIIEKDAEETFSPNYSNTEITFSGNLPNMDSTVSYYVTFFNNTSKVWEYNGILELINNNSDVIYETMGLTKGFTISPNTKGTIRITFKYNERMALNNTSFGFKLDFNFIEYNNNTTQISSYVLDNLILNLRGLDSAINNEWVDTLNNRFILNGNIYKDEVENCYIFDGDGDYMVGSSPYIPETEDFTLELYIKTPAIEYQREVDQAIISQVANNTNSSGRFKINVKRDTSLFKNTSLITFYSNNSSIYTSPPSEQHEFIKDIDLTTRYHLQLVRTNNKLYYYVDNILTNTITIQSDSKISQENLKIGKWNNVSTQYFNGSIYAIRIYDDALSYNELKSNYNADLDNYPTRLIANVKEKMIDKALSYSYETINEGLHGDIYGNLIYKGTNPNNYVKIEDDVYRIIAFNNDNTIRLMKITNPLTYIPYDNGLNRVVADTYCIDLENGCNAWTTNDYGNNNIVTTNASLNDYLNTTYYNSLSENLKSIMVDGTYNIGKVNSKATYEKVKEQEKTKTWIGKVGLYTVRNVMEASIDVPNLESATIKNNYITSMSSLKVNYWTISATTDNDWDVWIVLLPTSISKRKAIREIQEDVVFNALPVIHISSDTLVKGSGTSVNPYLIEFES